MKNLTRRDLEERSALLTTTRIIFRLNFQLIHNRLTLRKKKKKGRDMAIKFFVQETVAFFVRVHYPGE